MKITTIHDAVQNAALDIEKHSLKIVAFRGEVETLPAAHEICQRHGTSLSGFLRQCIRSLVDDYCPPKNISE